MKETSTRALRIMEKAYFILVRPILEYGSAAWDPYRNCQINRLERVQRRAARFVTRTDNREEGCVARALNRLNWQHRRRVARLGLLHKAVHNNAAITIPLHVQHKSSSATQNFHLLKFIPVQTSCDAYKFSFWPRTTYLPLSLLSDGHLDCVSQLIN